jgi:hypothetical protein
MGLVEPLVEPKESPGEATTTWGGCLGRTRRGRAHYEAGSSTLLTTWWRTFLRFRRI